MLRTDFSNSLAAVGKIGILAGGGLLPSILAQELISNGHAPYIVNLLPIKPSWLGNHEFASASITQLSMLIKSLRSANVSTLVLAGSISARPSVLDFVLDWRLYTEFPALYRALQRGDDGLLSAAIDFLERRRFRVMGAHEIAPSLLATESILTIAKPTQAQILDIKQAIGHALVLGGKDVGQAVVVSQGHLIAQETRSGTQAMLATLSQKTTLPKSGVLLKWSKPNQELRVDLPSIGPDTVNQAVAAGLSGIVVEAAKSLILDRDEVVRRANANGLFVVGMRETT